MTPPPAASHRIRLRGPWGFAWREHPENEPTEVRKKHPDDWQEFIGQRSGTVELTRRFHTPSNLDPEERVFIILEGVRGTGQIQLNDVRLGEFDQSRFTWEFPVPLPLPFSNLLRIVITFPAADSPEALTGLYGPVALEIRGEPVPAVSPKK